MNAAVRSGIEASARAGAEGAIVLPGDLPSLAAEDLRALIDAAEAAASPRVVVLARDRAGSGTNALLLRPPGCLEPAFGSASAERHLARARETGAAVVEVQRPGLAADVDTPLDLASLDLRAERRHAACASQGTRPVGQESAYPGVRSS
jgi:2-phospho-L-lactate guanylyltransferase